MDWNSHFSNMLGEATELMCGGHLMEATEAIQRALGGTTPLASAPAAAAATAAAGVRPRAAFTVRPGPARSSPVRPARARPRADVQDAVVRECSPPAPGARAGTAQTPRADRTAAPARPATAQPLREAPDSFERITFMHAGVRHHYRLYVPPGAGAGTPMPLVLMLHGCTQDADDFAVGTGMNGAAAQANALVLYPAQARSANPNGCWNWFEPAHQHRGQGELALLVAMVQDVVARHPVDTRRVYAAGLSAGGALAALLGREYPDLFAAVGVHSGLQAGAADNMMAALSAMNNGAKAGAPTQLAPHPSGAPHPALIVFHGDADTTVHAKNGQQLVDAALQASLGGKAALQQDTQQGQSHAGQRFTRTVYRAAAGSTAPGAPEGADVLAEHWVLHSAGHAWSGGNARGSHTDARGVNASQEMLRFFLAHVHAS